MKKILTTFKFLGLLIAINLLSFSQVAAECTINSGTSTDHFNSRSGDVLVTQVFTACETGPFKSFSFDLFSHGYKAEGVSVSIDLYNTAPTIAPTAFNLGTFDIIPVTAGDEETFTFTPTNSYEVTAGVTYQIRMTMDIQSAQPLRGTASGRSGGIEFSQTTPTDAAIGTGSVTSLSPLRSGAATGRMMPALAFNMLLGNPAAAAVAPVPTMSEWGLLIFGLLVLNLGLVFVYKKELNY